MNNLRALVRELRRRRVFNVLAVYIVAAAAVSQAADVMLPRLGLPDWTVTLVVALSVLGLPLVAAVAWAFDVTPGGIRRTGPAPEASPDPPGSPGPRSPAPGAAAHPRAGMALILFLVLGTGATMAWFLAPRDAAPPAGPEVTATLAVLPFSFRGGEQYAYLATGMVDLLSTKLDGAGRLRSVAPRAVLGMVRQEGGDMQAAAAATVARRLGAGLYVLGEVVEVDGRLHLSAQVHDGTAGEAPHRASVEGEAERIFALVDDLASQLISGMAGGPGLRVTRVAAATTHSLPALKAYLQGEELLRGGHFQSALESFERAIEADSTFALAYYRHSIAAEWSGSMEATSSAAEAYRLSGRLSTHDRRLVEALLAWRRGDAAEAERLYRVIVGAYPDDVEAWLQLAEVLFHYGAWQGRGVGESRAAFERVVYYEPEHATSLWHVARIAGVEGNAAEVDTLTRRVVALAPEGDRILELVALRASVAGDTAALARVVDDLRDGMDLTRYMTAWNLSAFAGDLAGTHRVAATMTEPTRAPEVRSMGHLVRAYAALGLGRPSVAANEIAAVSALDPANGPVHEAALALHPGADVTPGRLRQIRDALLASPPAPEPSGPTTVLYFDLSGGAPAESRWLLAGLLSARIGERRVATDAIARLQAVPPESPNAGLAADFARTLQAEVALAGGDTAAALDHVERLRGEVWYARVIQSPIVSQAYARYRRAELLEWAGRPREALTWFSSFAELNIFDTAWEPWAALRRARILDALGETDAAAAERARAASFWKDAEPARVAGVASSGGVD